MPDSTSVLALNAHCNLDVGSKGCPIGSECRDVVEGIANGEFTKVALNGGALALCSVGNGGAVANAKVKVGLNSASNGVMIAQLGGISACN